MTIKQKLIYLMILFTFLLVGVMGYGLYQEFGLFKKIMRQQSEQRAFVVKHLFLNKIEATRRIVDMLNVDIRNHNDAHKKNANNRQYERLKNIIKPFVQNTRMDFIQIYDLNGNLIAQSKNAHIENTFHLPSSILQKAKRFSRAVSQITNIDGKVYMFSLAALKIDDRAIAVTVAGRILNVNFINELVNTSGMVLEIRDGKFSAQHNSTLAPLIDRENMQRTAVRFDDIIPSAHSFEINFYENTEAANRQFMQDGVLGIILLLFISIFTFGVVISIINSIKLGLHKLSELTMRVMGGDLDYDMPVVKTKDEIGKLSNDFNSMRVALKEQREDLNRQKDKLIDANKNLEDVNEKLVKANISSETANRAKSVFLANMSHEIRTPLNGILGITELLEKTKLTEKQNQYTRTISKSGWTLFALINDILDLSKIESGKLELEKINFDLLDLVDEVISLYNPNANKKNIRLMSEIDEEIPRYVIGDPLRLRQILNNLINNAIKFTDAGKVCLTIEYNAELGQNQRILFKVQDSGIGIAPDRLDKVFSVFTQETLSTTRRYGGSGLGLSITKQLCELMGGTISVASEQGKGATFTCAIPMPEAPQNYLSNSKNRNEKNEPKDRTLIFPDSKILLVEDNHVNQQVCSEMLEQYQCKVTVADHGGIAFEAMQQDTYDLVIMDCQMPVVDGYHGTCMIREYEEKTKEHLPIIALTAGAMSIERDKCLAAGMDDYMSKPVTLFQLETMLAKWLPEKMQVVECQKKPESTMPIPIVDENIDNAEDEIIDITALQRISLIRNTGDNSLLKKICKMYAEESKQIVNEINEAVEKNDSSRLAKSAHALKSSSVNLGATQVVKICKRLEKNEDFSLENKQSMTKRLSKEFDIACNELEKYCRELK